MRVFVAPHDPQWAVEFAAEAARLREGIGAQATIEHIGSTAIVGIHAKPIIDILASVADFHTLDEATPNLQKLGYEAMGEFGIPGRRYFRKSQPDGTRTHHLHAFLRGSEHATRHLAFRDYMNAHPKAAADYGALKRRLAAAHPQDMNAYMDGKDAFVKAHEAKALAWMASCRAAS